MSAYLDAQARREWAANNTATARALRGVCPDTDCIGGLDTGYECTECGMDALPLIQRGDHMKGQPDD